MSSNTTRDLYAVWGNSANSVFAVGGMQTIRYWNGTTWTAMTTPGLESNFNAVWGTAFNNVYAVGLNGDIYHFDGTAWSAMDSGTSADLYAIQGSSSSDIWAVGSATAQTHYNGSVWNSLTIHPLMVTYTALWGTSASNIYMSCHNVFTDAGLVKHYDGSSWSNLTTPDCPSLNGIWGSSNSDIFAVGDSGTILHYGSGCRTTITSFTPTSGGIGTLVIITGANFTRTTSVTFGGTPAASFTVNSDSQIAAYLDTGATGKVMVSTPFGTALSAADFTFIISKISTTPHGSSMPGSITAPTQQGPVTVASISVKKASLSATKVSPGTPVAVTADVVNTGAVNGASNIKVYVNGQEESSRGVTISSGSSTPVTFAVTRNEPGTYSVYVGGTNAGSFTVDALADPNIILYISGALLVFAFVLGVIFITRRRQAH
jgi:hypothetical protein